MPRGVGEKERLEKGEGRGKEGGVKGRGGGGERKKEGERAHV